MRYIIGFLVTIGLIIVALILIFHGGNGGQQKPQTDAPALSQYSQTSTTVRWTVDGPVNNTANHRQVRVTVGQIAVIAEVLQGYDGTVIKSETYPNNTAAYAAFLHSLTLAGYTKGDTDPKLRDERGYCATGDRYVYEVANGSTIKEHYWHTSCGKGTYLGASELTNGLFRAQVPSYSTFTSGVNVY
jgi:hypothetical protein